MLWFLGMEVVTDRYGSPEDPNLPPVKWITGPGRWRIDWIPAGSGQRPLGLVAPT